jgi:hypothetical protein
MTFKQGFFKVVEWFVGSLCTLGIGLLLLYKTEAIATQKGYEDSIQNSATKQELKETKKELQTEIKAGDDQLREEMQRSDDKIIEHIDRYHLDVIKMIELSTKK